MNDFRIDPLPLPLIPSGFDFPLKESETMHEIYWFPLTTKRKQTIQMQDGAKIIHAGMHSSGTLAIWAIVDPDAIMIEREFLIYGTGHQIENIASLRFVGTIKDNDGEDLGNGYVFMWHLFEKVHNTLPPKD